MILRTAIILLAIFVINCKTTKLRDDKITVEAERTNSPVARKHYYPEFYLATPFLKGPEKIGYFALFAPATTSQSLQADGEKAAQDRGDFFLVEYDKSSSSSSVSSALSNDQNRLGLSGFGFSDLLENFLKRFGFLKDKKAEVVPPPDKELFGYHDFRPVKRSKFSTELTGKFGEARAPQGTKDPLKTIQDMSLHDLKQAIPELNFPDDAIVGAPRVVYRGTGYSGVKSVYDIFLHGLKAQAFSEMNTKPLNIDPYRHTSTASGSAFISTSTSISVADSFMPKLPRAMETPSYLWELDTPANKGLDTAVSDTYFPHEKEISILGNVNGSNIRGVWKLEAYSHDHTYHFYKSFDLPANNQFYRWIPNPLYFVSTAAVEKALIDTTESSLEAAQLAVLTRRLEIEKIKNNPFMLEKALKLAGVSPEEYGLMRERKKPLGFSDEAQWKAFQTELQAALNQSGRTPDSSVRVKGTPTTLLPEYLEKNIEDDMFTYSESSPPTLDIQVASEFYRSELELKETPISPNAEEIFSPLAAEKALPRIEKFCIKWRKTLKMEINMTFLTKPKAAISGPNDFIVPI